VRRDQDASSVAIGPLEPVKPIRFKNVPLARVLACVLLPLAVWLVVATVNDYGGYTAYQRATSCPAASGTGTGTGTDCLSTVTAAVVDGDDKGGDYSLTLQGSGTTTWQITLPNACNGEDLYTAAQDSESVQAQLWHGGVTEVSVDGMSCELSGSPGAAYAKVLGILLIVGPLDVFILLVWASSFAGARFGPGPAQLIGRTAMGFLVVLLLCVGAGAGLSATGRPAVSALYLGDGIVVGVFALAGLILLIFRRNRRSNRRRPGQPCQPGQPSQLRRPR
jgi:hypothetical protein